jgi:hypothetical protein
VQRLAQIATRFRIESICEQELIVAAAAKVVLTDSGVSLRASFWSGIALGETGWVRKNDMRVISSSGKSRSG